MAWIESGEHDRHIYMEMECTYRYHACIRPLYRFNKRIQKYLTEKGIPLHDYVFGECTHNFQCCVDNKLSKAFKLIKGYILPNNRKEYCEHLKGMKYGGLPKNRQK